MEGSFRLKHDLSKGEVPFYSPRGHLPHAHAQKLTKILDKFPLFNFFPLYLYRSNHSGKGSSGSLPSSSGACTIVGGSGTSGIGNGIPNPDESANNGEYYNNNHSGGDNSLGSEVCDVPYEVANQKRHVSILIQAFHFKCLFDLTTKLGKLFCLFSYTYAVYVWADYKRHSTIINSAAYSISMTITIHLQFREVKRFLVKLNLYLLKHSTRLYMDSKATIHQSAQIPNENQIVFQIYTLFPCILHYAFSNFLSVLLSLFHQSLQHKYNTHTYILILHALGAYNQIR